MHDPVSVNIRQKVIHEVRALDLNSPLSALSLVKYHFPLTLGGEESGYLRRAYAIEELSRISPCSGALLSAASLGTGLLLEGGSPTQIKRWLPSLGAGTDIMTICMTEHNSGSHLLGMQTTATPCQNGWIINGAKRFIGNSHIATVHGVIARTSSANNRNSLTAFAIPAESPGVVLGEEHGLSGLQGFSLGEIKFHNCFVPDSHRIGQVGEGLRLAHQVVAHHGKPNISALAIGLHARILDRLLEYTAGRKLYGNPIATLPAIERVITEIYSKLYTSRVLMHDAASNLDRGINNELGIGIAKLTASDNAINAALQATRAMGAIGNHPELGIVQSLMDALMTSAPSGTEEVIMKRIFEHINRVEARV